MFRCMYVMVLSLLGACTRESKQPVTNLVLLHQVLPRVLV